jgi:hypothetical protein
MAKKTKPISKMTPQEFFEHEKKGYEKRTGDPVLYVPPIPITEPEAVEAEADDDEAPADESQSDTEGEK